MLTLRNVQCWKRKIISNNYSQNLLLKKLVNKKWKTDLLKEERLKRNM